MVHLVEYYHRKTEVTELCSTINISFTRAQLCQHVGTGLGGKQQFIGKYLCEYVIQDVPCTKTHNSRHRQYRGDKDGMANTACSGAWKC